MNPADRSACPGGSPEAQWSSCFTPINPELPYSAHSCTDPEYPSGLDGNAAPGLNPVSGNEFSSAAILAGGRSRRMGGIDKQDLVLGGEPMMHRQIRVLSAHFDHILIVASDTERYARTAHPQGGTLRVISDSIPGFGPLSGLHAALKAMSGHWLFLMACDMPDFSPMLAHELASLARKPVMSLRGQDVLHEGHFLPCSLPLVLTTAYKDHFEPFHAYYARELLNPLEVLFNGWKHAGESAESAEGNPGFRPAHIHRRIMEPAVPESLELVKPEPGKSESKVPGPRFPSFKNLMEMVPHALLPEADARRHTPDWMAFYNINVPEDMTAYVNQKDPAVLK